MTVLAQIVSDLVKPVRADLAVTMSEWDDL